RRPGLLLHGRLVQEWRKEPVRLLRIERADAAHLLVGRERGATARWWRDADVSWDEADYGARRLLVQARAVRHDHNRRPDCRREPRHRGRAALEPALQRYR